MIYFFTKLVQNAFQKSYITNMSKRMHNVTTKRNDNIMTVKFHNNRNAIVASLSRFRPSTFDDRREDRGGATNVSRDYIDEYEGENDCE